MTAGTAGVLTRRFGALTSSDVAALDGAAVASGVSVQQLMEIAGWQVARCAWLLVGERPARVGVVAGRGNNGGDALVAARHLETWGCDVGVVRIGDAVVDANTLHERALVIDGILGTGLHSPPRDPQASAIRGINASGARVLAIDIPSGLDASDGIAYEPCVRAAATCTLTAMKAGLWTETGRAQAGDVWLADIGMPLAAWLACGLPQPSAVRGGSLVRVPD